MLKILRMALIFLLTSLVLLTTGGQALAQPPMVKVIIMFSKPSTFAQREGPLATREIRGFGGQVRHQYRIIPAMSAEIPRQFLDRMRKFSGVAFIEEDQPCYAIDAELDNSWGVKRIGAGTVHSYNKGTEVKVAIIDSGIDLDHPDLQANIKGGYNAISGGSYNDDYGHGTHVAGIVAALDNDTGVVGVAPDVQLYSVKVLNSGGGGYWSDVIEGIQWATDPNGDGNTSDHMGVINMSLGGTSGVTALQSACNAAEAAGVVVVAAAGNSGYSSGTGDNVLYPARYTSVIAVAATDSTDTRASFSSTGPAVELAAPQPTTTTDCATAGDETTAWPS